MTKEDEAKILPAETERENALRTQIRQLAQGRSGPSGPDPTTPHPADAEIEKKLHQLEDELRGIQEGRQLTWLGRGKCTPSFVAYRYIKVSKRPDAKGTTKPFQCEPNGGCPPGTLTQKNGSCAPDDRSRFALDPNGNTKIELTISAVNTGSMNYQKIDATRLDLFPSIIVPGNSALGFPFPALKATNKNTNRVALTVVMPQGLLKADQMDDHTKQVVAHLGQIDTSVYWSGAVGKDRLYELTAEVLAELTDANEEYKNKCAANPLKVDFLALQRYIGRIVDEQEQQIFAGPPQIALDSMVLTSEFQLIFDATAGTQHLLRIVPVLQPPVLGLNPDHTHNLKITFAGGKARALATGGISLIQRCIARLRNTPAAERARECNTPEAIQREAVIEALENSRPGSGG
jgi:hypothetical protein